MARLLVVHHSPSETMQRLTERVIAGANDPELATVEVNFRRALEATVDDVLAADGYVLGTPANFGYMSGALKHFFDTVFLHVGGALDDDGSARPGASQGKPFGLYVHGRYDTQGAIQSVRAITGALGWRQAFDVVDVLGDVDAHLDRAYELGATLAAVLLA